MTFHHKRRLDRALYHLECLKTEVADWLKEDPYRVWTELDVKGTKKCCYVEVLKPPPAEKMSVIIGDCLHNLRATLDNLVLELAIAYKRGQVSKSVESDSGFPIFRTCSEKNLKELNSMLRGINPHAKTIIEGLQSYKRGNRFATNDPLWKLNQLSNIDKHRLPHIAGFVTVSVHVRSPLEIDMNEIEIIFCAVENRAAIARYPATDHTGTEVNVQLTPTFSVGFGQHVPEQVRNMSIPDTLTRMHDYILNAVLSRLTNYLT